MGDGIHDFRIRAPAAADFAHHLHLGAASDVAVLLPAVRKHCTALQQAAHAVPTAASLLEPPSEADAGAITSTHLVEISNAPGSEAQHDAREVAQEILAALAFVQHASTAVPWASPGTSEAAHAFLLSAAQHTRQRSAAAKYASAAMSTDCVRS